MRGMTTRDADHHDHDHDHEDDETVSFERTFDDGERILLRDDGEGGVPPGIVAIDAAPCTGTECPCHDVELLVQPMAFVDGKLVEGEGEPLQALLDAESGDVSVEGAPEPGSAKAVLLGRLRRVLAGEPLELLKDRWRRARRQDDADEWKEADWEAIDLEAMVPFLEIFPSRWDLSVSLEGRRFWVVDLWCLNPDCPCTDVALDFVAADDDSAEQLMVDLSTGEADDPEASEAAKALWDALRADAGTLEELKRRREATRRVARELPRHLGAP
jgi:hypothetical protein